MTFPELQYRSGIFGDVTMYVARKEPKDMVMYRTDDEYQYTFLQYNAFHIDEVESIKQEINEHLKLQYKNDEDYVDFSSKVELIDIPLNQRQENYRRCGFFGSEFDFENGLVGIYNYENIIGYMQEAHCQPDGRVTICNAMEIMSSDFFDRVTKARKNAIETGRWRHVQGKVIGPKQLDLPDTSDEFPF